MSGRELRAAGFPSVADLLEAGLPRAAWNALRRFKPASIGEAMALEQARKAMPDVDAEDDGDL